MTDNFEKISDDKVNELNSRQKMRDIKKIIRSKKLNYDDVHREIGELVTNRLSKEHVAIWKKENSGDIFGGGLTVSFQTLLGYKIFADKDEEISKILDEWMEKNK